MKDDRHSRQRRWIGNAVGLLIIGAMLVVVYGSIILAFFGVDVRGVGS